MDMTPTPGEPDQDLRQIRHQQAESIRNGYKPDPWWSYAVLTAFFVSFGLGKDLDSVWVTVAEVGCWVVLVGMAWVQLRRRKNRPSSPSARSRNDVVVWIVAIAFAVAVLAILFGGPHVLASLGVPLPHAVSGLLVGLALIAAIPLGPWSARRSAARVESGK